MKTMLTILISALLLPGLASAQLGVENISRSVSVFIGSDACDAYEEVESGALDMFEAESPLSCGDYYGLSLQVSLLNHGEDYLLFSALYEAEYERLSMSEPNAGIILHSYSLVRFSARAGSGFRVDMLRPDGLGRVELIDLTDMSVILREEDGVGDVHLEGTLAHTGSYVATMHLSHVNTSATSHRSTCVGFLDVTAPGGVANRSSSWGQVKSLYR